MYLDKYYNADKEVLSPVQPRGYTPILVLVWVLVKIKLPLWRKIGKNLQIPICRDAPTGKFARTLGLVFTSAVVPGICPRCRAL